MALRKPIILSDPQTDASVTKALEEAYLKWVQYFSARHSHRPNCSFVVKFCRPQAFWKSLDRGAISSLTLFPSTEIWECWTEQSAVSVAEAIGSDWHAVGKDLYSAIVKDRIKTHNCGQSSFSFEPESEPESAVTT